MPTPSKIKFFYDPRGQLIRTLNPDGTLERIKKMILKPGGIVETVVYMGGIEYHKRTTSSTTETKTYTQVMGGVEIREGSFSDDTTDSVIYTLSDHLGSATIRLDENGTLIDKEEYYSFGDCSLRSFDKRRYRYCGKEKDNESGLYYYGARYYEAWTCRFISVDPLAQKYNQLTPYNYAGNEPIGDKDIDGMQSEKTPEGGGNENSNQDNHNIENNCSENDCFEVVTQQGLHNFRNNEESTSNYNNGEIEDAKYPSSNSKEPIGDQKKDWEFIEQKRYDEHKNDNIGNGSLHYNTGKFAKRNGKEIVWFWQKEIHFRPMIIRQPNLFNIKIDQEILLNPRTVENVPTPVPRPPGPPPGPPPPTSDINVIFSRICWICWIGDDDLHWQSTVDAVREWLIANPAYNINISSSTGLFSSRNTVITRYNLFRTAVGKGFTNRFTFSQQSGLCNINANSVLR